MKKGVFIILILMLLIETALAINVNDTLGTEEMTGRASAQPTNVSLFVMLIPPTLTLLSPRNGTYLLNESLFLSYNVYDEEAMWYILDNSANITITSPIYFNASEGSHFLHLYAGNFMGVTEKNVTFAINSSKLIIIDDQFDRGTWDDAYYNKRELKKGESTDFFSYTYEELQHLGNMIFHIPEFGKIKFNEVINVLADENPFDNKVDFNRNINISFNRIEINSIALPNLNKSATLWLYNLTFANPRVLRNNEICPSDICVIESYSNGTLKFNVTGFTVYSTEETPVPPAGGGISPAIKIINFSTDKSEIMVDLKQGESKTERITIWNTGDFRINVSFDIVGIKNLVSISKKSFEMKPGDIEVLTLDFMIPEDLVPDLYTGKLVVSADGVRKEIPIEIEVESKAPLFNIEMEMKEYFFLNEEITAKISLYGLGLERDEKNIKIEYFIKDDEGKNILSENETVLLKTRVVLTKTFRLSGAESGRYTLYVKASYQGQSKSASARFFILKEMPFIEKRIDLKCIAIAIALLLIIFILIKIARRIYYFGILRKSRKKKRAGKKPTRIIRKKSRRI